MFGVGQNNQKWLVRFKPEAARHVAELAGGLRQLDFLTLLAPPDPQVTFQEIMQVNPALRELYRLAHTLKGSAGMVGHAEIAGLAEKIEKELAGTLFNPAGFDEALRRELLALTAQIDEKVKQIGQE